MLVLSGVLGSMVGFEVLLGCELDIQNRPSIKPPEMDRKMTNNKVISNVYSIKSKWSISNGVVSIYMLPSQTPLMHKLIPSLILPKPLPHKSQTTIHPCHHLHSNTQNPHHNKSQLTALISNKHSPIPNLTLPQLLHALLNTLLVEREFLDHGLNLMLSSEFQHFAVDLAGSDDGTDDFQFGH